jgi:hypothetical protein
MTKMQEMTFMDQVLTLTRNARGRGMIRGKVIALPKQNRILLEASPRKGTFSPHRLIFEMDAARGEIWFFPSGFTRNRFYLSSFPNLEAWFEEAIRLNTGNHPFLSTHADKATYKFFF